MPRKQCRAVLVLTAVLLGIATAAAECPVAVSGPAPLGDEEVARIEAACGPTNYKYAADYAVTDCAACLCPVEQALFSRVTRSHSSQYSPRTQTPILSRCPSEAAGLLESSDIGDVTLLNIIDCLNVEAQALQQTMQACSQAVSGAVLLQQRRLMLDSVVPGEVNQTITDAKSGINSATATVQSSFNNASAGFNQLGQTSALNQAGQSQNASAGDYVNAFVNDTNRALGVIGSVFKSSAEQSVISKLSVIVIAALAVMLGLPLL